MRADPRAFRRMLAGLDQLRATVVHFGLIHTLTSRSWPELGWLGRFAESQGADLLQLHPIEATGRASTGADHLAGIELSKAWLATRALTAEYRDRFRVHVDVMTRRALLDTPDLDGQPDTLVVEADGTVVPFTYGMSRAYRIADLTCRRLRDAWPEFVADRYDRLRELHRVTRESCLAGPAQLFSWFEELVARSEGVPCP
jgi:hypothetical protein